MMRLLLKIFLIILFSITNISWFWGSSVAAKNKEGNKLYKEGRFDEALSKWRDAQIDSPDKKELHYNIGNGLYEQKKYEESFNEYEKSLDTKNTELQLKAYYNMGNAHYRMGKLVEAIEDYKKCLDINPDDEDAKYNIEFIRKKIKENLQKKPATEESPEQKRGETTPRLRSGQGEQKPEKEGQEQQQESQKSQSQQEQQQELGTEEESEKKESQGQKPETPNHSLRSGSGQAREQKPEEEKTEDRGQKAEEGEMSKEDAMRLLDALKDDEKDLQKELRKQPIEGEYRVEKDW